MSPQELAKARARSAGRAKGVLRKKYAKEFDTYFETKAWGDTYVQRYQSTLRYLKYRHPKVYTKCYKSFLELEGILS